MNKIFDNLYANIGKHRRNRIENYAQYGCVFTEYPDITRTVRFFCGYPVNTRKSGIHEEKKIL